MKKTKYIEIIGSDRMAIGVITFIAFCISLFLIQHPSIIGILTYTFIGIPYIIFCYIVILFDFIRLSKNTNINSEDKAQIHFFLIVTLIVVSLLITPFYVIDIWSH